GERAHLGFRRRRENTLPADAGRVDPEKGELASFQTTARSSDCSLIQFSVDRHGVTGKLRIHVGVARAGAEFGDLIALATLTHLRVRWNVTKGPGQGLAISFID